jgi:polyisoprenoid-binding protein YceI
MLTVLGVMFAALLQTPGESTSYVVDAARSSVVVHVGKAGVFKFAGHAHDVLAPRVSGEVVAVAEPLSRSSVKLSFESAALKVSEKDEPAGDAPKVDAVMAGPKVLDVAKFPSIAFVSSAVTGRAAGAGAYELEVAGDLTLHGVTRRISVPVRVALQPDGLLKATGGFALRQTNFGITPVSVAGVVNVKDELRIDFEIVATRGR